MTEPAGVDLEAGLGRLWDAVAARLERTGLRPQGTVRLVGLDRDERRALTGLLGRPVTATHATVDLADLDRRLRSVHPGRGLVALVEAGRGRLVDRVALRAATSERRVAIWAAAREALRSAGLADQDWTEGWLEDLRAAGTLARLDPDRARASVTKAVQVLAALPILRRSRGRVGRTELANRLTGNSHGLDDGRTLASLVLRGVAQLSQTAFPESAAGRRALWETAGVLSDEISTTVLTLGLAPKGTDPLAAGIRARSDANCETHLTLRDLRRIDQWVEADTDVFVCENPRVIEAAIDAGVRRPMVCTAGNPRVVVNVLLEQLGANQARLRYRGDFDWPGVGIANRIITEHGARPWRMGADDYQNALAQSAAILGDLLVLEGRPVDAVWDAELTPIMVTRGRAVHEEALLEVLVADLRGGTELG